MVFIAEGGNLQAFFKTLKDLEQHQFERVCLIFIAESPDELPFLAEIEYWMQATKWTVEVTLATGAPADWPHQTGDLDSALPYRKMPNAAPSTVVFASVSNARRADLSDRLVAKGYRPAAIRWFN